MRLITILLISITGLIFMSKGCGEADQSADEEQQKTAVPGDEAFQQELSDFFLKYVTLSDALADDDVEKAREVRDQLIDELEPLEADHLQGQRKGLFDKQKLAMKESLERMNKGENIEEIRTSFEILSEALLASIRTFGITGTEAYLIHCPMAFDDKGANWLHNQDAVLNPYFGEKMLNCGSVREKLN